MVQQICDGAHDRGNAFRVPLLVEGGNLRVAGGVDLHKRARRHDEQVRLLTCVQARRDPRALGLPLGRALGEKVDAVLLKGGILIDLLVTGLVVEVGIESQSLPDVHLAEPVREKGTERWALGDRPCTLLQLRRA